MLSTAYEEPVPYSFFFTQQRENIYGFLTYRIICSGQLFVFLSSPVLPNCNTFVWSWNTVCLHLWFILRYNHRLPRAVLRYYRIDRKYLYSRIVYALYCLWIRDNTFILVYWACYNKLKNYCFYIKSKTICVVFFYFWVLWIERFSNCWDVIKKIYNEFYVTCFIFRSRSRLSVPLKRSYIGNSYYLLCRYLWTADVL